MPTLNTKRQPFNLNLLIMFTLLFACCFSSAQASTDATSIGISVVVNAVKSPCQLSLGLRVNESSNSCQLSEHEFAQKIAQQPVKSREQTVTQRDGSLSIRVSITAP